MIALSLRASLWVAAGTRLLRCELFLVLVSSLNILGLSTESRNFKPCFKDAVYFIASDKMQSERMGVVVHYL